jgi:hypothetical protein
VGLRSWEPVGCALVGLSMDQLGAVGAAEIV